MSAPGLRSSAAAKLSPVSVSEHTGTSPILWSEESPPPVGHAQATVYLQCGEDAHFARST